MGTPFDPVKRPRSMSSLPRCLRRRHRRPHNRRRRQVQINRGGNRTLDHCQLILKNPHYLLNITKSFHSQAIHETFHQGNKVPHRPQSNNDVHPPVRLSMPSRNIFYHFGTFLNLHQQSMVEHLNIHRMHTYQTSSHPFYIRRFLWFVIR
jgi:hypothetical protein